VPASVRYPPAVPRIGTGLRIGRDRARLRLRCHQQAALAPFPSTM